MANAAFAQTASKLIQAEYMIAVGGAAAVPVAQELAAMCSLGAQACAAQANAIFQEIVASIPELGGTGVGLAGISAIDKEAVDRALTKAAEVTAAGDGAGGAVNAPRTIPYQPPGSVIMQGNDLVCGVACTAMTISDAHGGTVSLAETIGSSLTEFGQRVSISMKYQRSSPAMAFKIPPTLC